MITATELLQAVGDFLREGQTGEESASATYKRRIAINILKIVERELKQGGRILDGDRAYLAGLDSSVFQQAPELRELKSGSEISDLPSTLARALRDGLVTEDDTLRRYLRRRSLMTLSIDNPRYSGFLQACEHWSDDKDCLEEPNSATAATPTAGS